MGASEQTKMLLEKRMENEITKVLPEKEEANEETMIVLKKELANGETKLHCMSSGDHGSHSYARCSCTQVANLSWLVCQ